MGCRCNGTLGNTGKPGCFPIQKVAKKHFFVPRYASDGTENKIDLTVDIDAAYINARLNDVDPTKRWYPTPGLLESVEDTRAESVKQSFPSGAKFKVSDGIRSFKAVSPEIAPRTFKQIEEFACVEIGVFEIDIEGSLIGSRRDGPTSNNLYPILIEKGSWDARWLKPTDTTVSGIEWNFDYSQIEKDGDLWMIINDEIIGINLLSVNGLFDVTGSVSSISTTGFTLTLETIYGDPVRGLVVGDFYDEAGGVASKIYNVTDGAAVAITSVTEGDPGVYAFVFGAQTSADVLRVTPVKTKYDFTAVTEVVITVP